MATVEEVKRPKILKQEFLEYLAQRIPDYRMPAAKFYSDFNAAMKKFAKEHERDISSILEITDVELLKQWQGMIGQSERTVYNARRHKTKAQEGMDYYIAFLEKKVQEREPVNISANSPYSENIDDETLEKASEGMASESVFFRKARNRKIRNQCAEKYGYKCYVCGMDFEKVYGERGKKFIEIHHKKPLSSYDGEHDILLEDLCALCSNCHSMVHHGKELIDVDELKVLFERHKEGRDLY